MKGIFLLFLFPMISLWAQESPETVPQVKRQEIHGGKSFKDTVLLEPDVVYRLDHLQPRGQYDYFAVDLKLGQRLTLRVSTGEGGTAGGGKKGGKGTSGPYAGLRLLDSESHEILRREIDSLPNRSEEKRIDLGAAGRFYILIGSALGMVTKDASFQIKIQ